MNRVVTALLLVLLIQCGLVAVLFWPEQTAPPADDSPPFAPFGAEGVDEIHIGDEFDNEAVLQRVGDQWLLPRLQQLPADAARVETLLRQLAGARADWPVAHTAAARQRFQVADYFYRKRVTLLSGDEKLATIFLGTSPGFRKVHARNEAQEVIYSIALDSVEVDAINSAWLDPRLLQVRAPLRLDSELYNLYYEDGEWHSATGGTPDRAYLDALIHALRSIEVTGVASEDLQRELSDVEPELVMQVESLGGDVTLSLLTLRGQRFILSSEFPLFFRLGADTFDALTAIDARRLAGEENGS